MKTTFCPKCFASLPAGHIIYRCKTAGCRQEDIIVQEADTSLGLLACGACGESLSAYCPYCGFGIMGGSGAASLSVSVAGAEGCGKSHYLAVLVNELRLKFSKAFDCSLFPAGGDDTILLYEKDYYMPVFIDGKCLPSTNQENISPLLYSLVFKGSVPQKSFYLTLYDACGKNFESISAMSALNRSIGKSGGVIFMIDPMDLPGLAEKYGPNPPKPSDKSVASILSRTIHLLRSSGGKQSLLKNIDTPIAVCLTKLDKIRDSLDISSFVADSSRQLKTNAFDLYDFESANLETQSFLDAMGGGEIVSQIASQFDNYAFFTLSSLGHQPLGGVIQQIVPQRVLDPMMWLFYKNNLIN